MLLCGALMLVSSLATPSQAQATREISDDHWPFPANATGAHKVENDDTVGLHNSHIGVLLRKSDATILGIWDARGWNLVAYQNATGTPAYALWSLELMPKNAEKPVGANALQAAPIAYEFDESKNGGATLRMKFSPVQAGDSRCAVTAEVSLGAGDQALRWRLNAQMLDQNSSVWSVRYPFVQVRAADSDEQTNRMVIPYRRGQLNQYGKAIARYDTVSPYPGPAVKFQFLAAYGEHTRRGFYVAAQDADGYDKQFVLQNQPSRNAVVFAIEHIPANRGVAGTSYSQPYDVVTQPFTGDWYDAARIYRAWWTKQIWASQGLLRNRKDVPDWLKRTQVMTRPSTTQPERTVDANVDAELALQKILNGRSFGGVWYGIYSSITGKAGLDDMGHGHLTNVRPDVANAVHQLKKQGIHHLAYLQSMIYTPLDSDSQDNAMALKNVARRRDGQPAMYGKLGYAMDRSTTWWQDREIAQATKAIKAGFDGIYLDSFGKSSPECFATDHGHPIGGGNTGIAGQREMARRVLAAIRKINPDAVLSGEDPVEAFRDLVQVNLFSVNVSSLPLYRVIWGDYSLGYGRVLRPSAKGADNMIPEMAGLFVNGNIIGRVYTDSGSTVLADPTYAAEKTALQQMAAYGEAAIEYLRFGEYLHPLEWAAALPQVTFYESVGNNAVTLPAVTQSVTRSYVDGSVGIMLVNIGAQKLDLQVPIDPTQRNGKSAKNSTAVLWRIDATGKRTKLAQGKSSWQQPLVLKSHEIAFLILQ
jgi:hypothetical protein